MVLVQCTSPQCDLSVYEVGIELWFLYSALLHNVTYLCMKFEVISFNTFEVMPRTRFREARTDRVTPV